MYESFYGFDKRAFATVPDIHRCFAVAELMAAQETLSQVIENGEGPGVVIGPAGVGKTMLCELLETRFRPTFHVVKLACGQLRELRDMLQSIVHQLRLPHQGQNEGELRLTLLDFLEPSEECPHGMLLLVDEAQQLSLELLEEVRMISNFVRNGSPRVRVVLLGNDRLEDNLTNPRLESLNQRLAARCYLQGLGREETRDYVEGLTTAAGGAPGLWTEDALRSIYDASAGVPRVVNQICNRALALGCRQQAAQVRGDMVQRAWSDLQQLPTPWNDEPETDEGESVVEFGTLEDDDAGGAGGAGGAAAAQAEPVSDSSAPAPPPAGPTRSSDELSAPSNRGPAADPAKPRTTPAKAALQPSPAPSPSEVSTIEMQSSVVLTDGGWGGGATSQCVGADPYRMTDYDLAPEAAERVAMIEERLAEIEQDCGEIEPPLSAAGEAVENPFGEFPEEEVVLADHIPLGDPQRTVGPRVTNRESFLLAHSLGADSPAADADHRESAGDPRQAPTPGMTRELEGARSRQREIGVDASAKSAGPHEPATVVPIFAATRDDRDMIVIEDEHPRAMQNREVIHQLRGS